MAVVGVARFCFIFSLRQGCIIIAVVQLVIKIAPQKQLFFDSHFLPARVVRAYARNPYFYMSVRGLRVLLQFLSAVALFLLTLGLAHAQDVAALLAADMEETAMQDDTQNSLLFAPSSNRLSDSLRSHNEEQLLRAQNLATGFTSLFLFDFINFLSLVVGRFFSNLRIFCLKMGCFH